MAGFEQIIQKAVEEKDIPGCVLVATNRDGSFTYNKTFGKRSLLEGGDQSPVQLNTIMWIASCTKLMTSVCALQLVSRGLIGLDEPVYKYLPELKNFPVLQGFNDDGSPIEEQHKKPITLRLLLTHTSGLCYDGMHPNLVKWLEWNGRSLATAGTILGRFDVPLVFEPGTSWAYGPGHDYAGLLIERATKQSLENYMRQNLWEPLGVKDMTFHLSKRPDLKARFADMSLRDEATGKVRFTDGRQSYHDENKGESADCFGGHGVFASPEEYIKVLRAVLSLDQEGKLLTKELVEELFRPLMNEGGIAGLAAVLEMDAANNAMGGLPKDVPKDYGLGGLVTKGDVPGSKKAGTLIWGGFPNLIWFIDRKTGLCGLFATQVVPPGDSKCAELVDVFEKGIYDLYGKRKGEEAHL